MKKSKTIAKWGNKVIESDSFSWAINKQSKICTVDLLNQKKKNRYQKKAAVLWNNFYGQDTPLI